MLSVILLFLSHPMSSPRANCLQKKSTIQSFTATLTATTPVQRIISCLKYCSSHLIVHLEPLFNTVARKILLKPFPPVASLFNQGKYQHSDDATAIWFDVPILILSVFPLVLPDNRNRGLLALSQTCSTSSCLGAFALALSSA